MDAVEEGERRAAGAVEEMLRGALGEAEWARSGVVAIVASGNGGDGGGDGGGNGGERGRAAEIALGAALAGAAVAGIVAARKWSRGRGRAVRAREIARGVDVSGDVTGNAGSRSNGDSGGGADTATVISDVASAVAAEGVEAARRAVREVVAKRLNAESDAKSGAESGRSDGVGEWVRRMARGMTAWLVRGVVYSAQERVNAPGGSGAGSHGGDGGDGGGLGWRGKRWVTMRDDRVRDSHEALDGQRVAIGSAFMTQSGPIRYPGDRAAAVSEWINCYPGDTRVDSYSDLQAIYRRWYEGPTVKVITASGVEFTCTPNHPILTNGDWKAAHLLSVGNELYKTVTTPVRGVGHPVDENLPPTMSELFDSASQHVEFGVQRIDGGSMDFHGDGFETKVEIIRPVGRLPIPSFGKEFNQLSFESSSLSLGLPSELSGLIESGLSSKFATDRQTVIGQSTASTVSGESIRSILLGGALTDRETVGCSLISEGDSMFDESIGDSSTGDTGITSNFVDGDATQVLSDRIVSIEHDVFRGHVYNLQTELGWYIANSIITHNCRCHLELLRT